MNQQEFQTAVSPILLRWPRGYSGDQVQLINDEVKTLSHPDFVRLVTHLLGSMRVAPMIPDFRKAISDLGIRPVVQVVHRQNTPAQPVEENFLYCLQDNVWADNNYIFIRGQKPGFIIKKDSPSHPYVEMDAQVRTQKIKEVRVHLSKNSYQKFIESLNVPTDGPRRAFSMEGV